MQFNNQNFNSEQFNGKNFFGNKIRKGISFAGFDFTSFQCGTAETGVMIQKINFFDLNNIELTSTTSLHGDGGKILDKRYIPKTLSVSLYIEGGDYDGVVKIIDEIKARTQNIEWNLDIMISGEIRRYTATLSSLIVPSFSKQDDHMEGVELEFLITSPHWYFPEYKQTALMDITGNTSRVVANHGNYKTFPIILIVGKENCNISAVNIFHKKIWIIGDGYKISLSENLSAGQVFEINYKEKICKKDEVEIPFSGIMMPMLDGQTDFSFVFEGSSNVNIFILHEPTFL